MEWRDSYGPSKNYQTAFLSSFIVGEMFLMDTVALQKESLDICNMICAVCDKHQIRYYLAAGTLLGAIRHKGFIPWDDDMDIEFSRTDYKRLREILRTELGDKLVIQEYQTDHKFPYPFTKVFKRNTLTETLCYPQLNQCGHAFVDLFPLSKCPSNEKISWAYFKLIEILVVSVLSKVSPEGVQHCGYKKKSARALFHFFRCFPTLFLQRMVQTAVWLFDMLSAGEYVCYTGGKYGYPFERYKSAWYQDTAEAVFEGRLYSIPSGWDALLTHKYGNYMQAPKPEDRKGHFEEM